MLEKWRQGGGTRIISAASESGPILSGFERANHFGRCGAEPPLFSDQKRFPLFPRISSLPHFLFRIYFRPLLCLSFLQLVLPLDFFLYIFFCIFFSFLSSFFFLFFFFFFFFNLREKKKKKKTKKKKKKKKEEKKKKKERKRERESERKREKVEERKKQKKRDGMF